MRDDLLICGLTALIVALPVLALHQASERRHVVGGEALSLAMRPPPARVIIIMPRRAAPAEASAAPTLPPAAARHC